MVEKKSTKAKSTPKKRATKKVEEPKPESELQQVVEPVKPREINWDVIGFSAAAITFLGGGLLYLVGWSYEVNWFAFFGMNMMQVLIPPQQIIAQSFSPLFYIFLMFVIALFVYARLRNWPYSNSNINLEEYLILAILAMIFTTMLSLLLDSYKGIDLEYFIPSITSPGELNSLGLAIVYFVVLLVLMFAPLWQLATDKHQPMSDLRAYQVKYRNLRIVSLVFIILVMGLGVGAFRGIEDAASGFRYSGGWIIEKVYVVTSIKNNSESTLNPALISKNDSLYGPFGLVAENEKSYFLIRWKNDDEKYFQRTPGLYIFPREGLIIIPANDPSLTYATPSATATDTPQPIPTLTVTPKPTKTVAPPIGTTATSQP